MPSTAEHLALAKRLRRFLEDVDPLSLPGQPIELLIAAAYWSALHHIDAVLAIPPMDTHPADDAERLRMIRDAGPRLQHFYRDYRELKTCYEDSIYRAVARTRRDVDLDVKPTFDRIVRKIVAILGDDYESI